MEKQDCSVAHWGRDYIILSFPCCVHMADDTDRMRSVERVERERKFRETTFCPFLLPC